MIRTQVYIPDNLHRDLKLLASSKGTNMSRLIREGAKLIVERKSKRRKKKFGEGFIGACKVKTKMSGQETINDYYKNFGE